MPPEMRTPPRHPPAPLSPTSSPGPAALRGASAGAAALRLWAQCGGRGGNCASYSECADAPYAAAACPPGSSCRRSSEWYHQCLPDPVLDGLGYWAQCGGKGGECARHGACADEPYTGQACPPGTACVRQSEWHHQCLFVEALGPESGNGNGGGGGGGPQEGAAVELWGQCGGLGGDCARRGRCADGPYPGLACAAGSACVRQSEWYHQCLPANSSAPAAAPGGGGAAVVPVWHQCGGEGGDCPALGCRDGPFPGLACAEGAACERLSNWYHQCRPAGGGSGGGGEEEGGGDGLLLDHWAQCGGLGGDCWRAAACADAPYPT
jgi:hypothetical protein